MGPSCSQRVVVVPCLLLSSCADANTVSIILVLFCRYFDLHRPPTTSSLIILLFRSLPFSLPPRQMQSTTHTGFSGLYHTSIILALTNNVAFPCRNPRIPPSLLKSTNLPFSFTQCLFASSVTLWSITRKHCPADFPSGSASEPPPRPIAIAQRPSPHGCARRRGGVALHV
jgi:hypothetical protein